MLVDWVIPDKYLPKLFQENKEIKTQMVPHIHPKYLRLLFNGGDYYLQKAVEEAVPQKYWAKWIYDENVRVRRMVSEKVESEYLQFMIHDPSFMVRMNVADRIGKEHLPDMIEDPEDRVREIVVRRIDHKYLPQMMFDNNFKVRRDVARYIDAKYLPKMINESDPSIIHDILQRMSTEELNEAKHLAKHPDTISKVNYIISRRDEVKPIKFVEPRW